VSRDQGGRHRIPLRGRRRRPRSPPTRSTAAREPRSRRSRSSTRSKPHHTDYLRHKDAPKLDPKGNVTEAWPAHEAIETGLGGSDANSKRPTAAPCRRTARSRTHGYTARLERRRYARVWASTQATFGTLGGPRGNAACAAETRSGAHGVQWAADFGSKLGQPYEARSPRASRRRPRRRSS
jgi:hypothetical protein